MIRYSKYGEIEIFMTALIAILGALFAFFLMVVVHEFGHFLVARLCGIKVIRFSVGFGKPLLSHRAKSGVEYVLGWLLLGGYVKMQDMWAVAEELGSPGIPFESASVWARMAVVLAGPVANFILAMCLFAGVFTIGVPQLKPIVEKVTANSMAAQAGVRSGQRIFSMGGWKTNSWEAVSMVLIMHMGDQKPLALITLDGRGNQETHRLSLNALHMRTAQTDLLHDLGVTPLEPLIPPVIGKVLNASPAEKAGIRSGDRILSVNGNKMPSWQAMVRWISTHPDHAMSLRVLRASRVYQLTGRVGVRQVDGMQTGFLGIEPEPVALPPALEIRSQYPWYAAPWQGAIETGRWIVFHVLVIKQLLLGRISLHALSGPVSIFQAAGTASAEGLMTFLQFAAFISVVLGVFNLLPIPGLDGGHFAFCLVEVIASRRIPMVLQLWLTHVGIAFLLCLTLFATMNDVLRLLK